MSVATYGAAELAEIYRRYEAARATMDLHYGPQPEDLTLALQAFLFANVMAFGLSYADWQEKGASDLDDVAAAIAAEPAHPLPLTIHDQRALVRDIRLLVYNTVTNAGTDCLPARYKETLEAAAGSIVDELAGL